MNYQETLRYLFSQLPMYQRIGAAAYKPGLENTLALCKLFGNPQDRFRSVHIAGTNGKGSTSHMLASILAESGLKTGLYTSPHLKDFRERIRINGKMIPKARVTEFVRHHLSEFGQIRPSFFELTAVLAFWYFASEGVDIAVIETGMGGRLDSTNVITPLLSVITNISMDHMQYLGDTLELIAGEKAGIIKPGVPVVIGETRAETAQVFLDKARETGSRILFADQEWSPASVKFSGKGISRLQMDIQHQDSPVAWNLVSPLAGHYQVMNILTAYASVQVLKGLGYTISGEQIRAGIRRVIRNTRLAGRWQILSRHPLTICDTGHNEGGLREVLNQIGRVPYHKLHFVFGAVNDKDLSPILGLLPAEAEYYFCKADIPRGLDAVGLASAATAAGLKGLSYGSVREAIKAAQKAAGPDDLVFIGGSTFVVAEAL